MSDVQIVLSTIDTAENARRIANILVDERLAACVSILPPVTSIYRWEGELHEAPELQLIIKTATDRVEALVGRLQELHPYEVPEILALPVSQGLGSYLDWLRDETR